MSKNAKPQDALKIHDKKEKSIFNIFFEKNQFIFVAFLCSAVLMTLVYYCYDLIPFGDQTVLRMDLYHQYGPLFSELYDRITQAKSFLYSWNSGLGSSFLGNYFNYLSSPVALVVLFFGHINIPESIAFMILIKNALASATLAYYLKRSFGKNDFSIAAFGIMYSFSGFFIAYYWNVMWIDAMYLLPLVVLGIENIVNSRKAKLYVLSLALSFFASYYMTYMICLFAVLYFLYYYACNFTLKDKLESMPIKKDENGKEKISGKDKIKYSHFLRSGWLFAISSITATCLMAFALIPTYFILQSCSATSGSFPAEWTSYNTVFEFLTNHLASLEPTIRSSGDTVLPNVYCGMLTVILVPLYLFAKKISVKEKTASVIILALFFLCFNYNVPNYIIHAFHFPNDLPYRFSYIYSFFLITLAYKALTHIKEFSGKEIMISGIAVTGFIIAAEQIGTDNISNATIIISIIATVVYTFVLWLMRNKHYQQSAVALLLMCCTFAEAAVSNTDHFEISQTKSDFTNGYEEFRQLKESLDKTEGNSNYRMELTNINTLMDNCWFNYNGSSIFSSMAYEKVANLQNQLGLKSNYVNSYAYKLQTPVYNSMMSFKYIVDNDYLNMNSDFYEHTAVIGKFNAYKYNYYLPIAYCADSDVAAWSSSSSNPFRVQSDYWKLATGVQDDVFDSLQMFDVDTDNINEASSVLTGNNLSFISKDSSSLSTITAFYKVEENSEVYLYVKSDDVDHINVSCGDYSYSQPLDEPAVLDAGYHKKGEVLTIEMPIDSDASSGSISAYAYSFNQKSFEKGYKILKSGGMNIESATDTTIKGSVDAAEDCILYTSIPYDKGWSIYVDGKKSTLNDITSLGDGALLALNLKKGKHTVQFSYSPRGLDAGIAISGTTAIALIIFFIIRKYRKSKYFDRAPGKSKLASDMKPGNEQKPNEQNPYEAKQINVNEDIYLKDEVNQNKTDE